MTTITRERIELFIKNPLEHGLTRGEQMELARIALASLEAEPVAWRYRTTDINGNPRQGWSFSEEASLMGLYQRLYAVPPVQETGVYKDMLNIISLLENNEWAEHCTSTVLGSLLESEITRLVGKEQPVPAVPDEWTIQDAVKFCRETGRQDAGSAMEAWNACRAAMLNGGKS